MIPLSLAPLDLDRPRTLASPFLLPEHFTHRHTARSSSADYKVVSHTRRTCSPSTAFFLLSSSLVLHFVFALSAFTTSHPTLLSNQQHTLSFSFAIMFSSIPKTVLLVVVALSTSVVLAAPLPSPDAGSAYTGIGGSANGGSSNTVQGDSSPYYGGGGLLGGGGG